ncbi:uncharacterized protein [Drosophila kikkawai]|uniref:Endonuclease/exonuclease/phosphatase domain-containing protein n=1 Tax=Drosophila kikkawai TaxID=30033 RepID=A0ABM3C7A0_DROKI|nr:uncharacterized protein LOC121502805 [Drosophila kikkawai]
MEKWGVRQQFTAPYTPQENPTERTNRTVKTMIAQLAEQEPTKWDEHLPELMLAYNSSTSESTKFSPAQLIFGKELRLPNTVFDAVTAGSGLTGENIGTRWKRLNNLREEATANMQEAAEKQKQHYNLRKMQRLQESMKRFRQRHASLAAAARTVSMVEASALPGGTRKRTAPAKMGTANEETTAAPGRKRIAHTPPVTAEAGERGREQPVPKMRPVHTLRRQGAADTDSMDEGCYCPNRALAKAESAKWTTSNCACPYTNWRSAAGNPERAQKAPEKASRSPARARGGPRCRPDSENPGKPAGEWEVVAKKPRAARRGRPDAVIVQANGKSYSEVLAMVTRRGDKQLSALGACVSKVRRTNNGNLLLEVARGSVESAETMKERIERVLGDSATVRASTESTKVLVLEIRNIDSITSKEEVCAAIAGQFNFEVGRVRVRSMRRGHSETQQAVVSLPIPLGKAVLQRGEVRIGWSMCRIRERSGPPRCFRCLETGHIAIHCKNPVDRSACCIKCGESGHKAARAAQDLLTQTVRERGSEVAILSEPYRIGSSRDWATDRTGKAALWLCGAGAQQMSDIKATDGFVRANVGGTWLYSCYLAPSLSLESFGRILDELSIDLRGRSNAVVGGDFNAWATEWGSSRTNARGRAVLETFASLDVVLLNEGSRQTFSRAGAGSVIDLTFVSSALARHACWRIGEVYTASDHEAIECTLGLGGRPSGTTPLPRRAFRQDTFRPRAFVSALEGFSVDEADGANGMANKLADALENACDQSMLQRRPFRGNHRPVFWWSEEIAELRRICHRSRRLLQRARSSPLLVERSERYKAARKALKIAIRDSKRESFLKLCDATEDDPWGGAYKMTVKKLNAGGNAPFDPEALEGIVKALFPDGQPVGNFPRAEPGEFRSVTEAEVLQAG